MNRFDPTGWGLGRHVVHGSRSMQTAGRMAVAGANKPSRHAAGHSSLLKPAHFGAECSAEQNKEE